MSRTCPSCQKTKAIRPDNWHRNKARKDGFTAYCKTCINSRYKEASPERKAYIRNQTYLKKYNMSYETFQQRLKEANNQCAICSIAFDNTRMNQPNVDHDHDTGEVRGILCRGCNTGLGNFKDNETSLKKAAEYLNKAFQQHMHRSAKCL